MPETEAFDRFKRALSKTHAIEPDQPERWRRVRTLCGTLVIDQDEATKEPTCDDCRQALAYMETLEP